MLAVYDSIGNAIAAQTVSTVFSSRVYHSSSSLPTMPFLMASSTLSMMVLE